ncbi:MAG: PAS domain S-box protein [Pontiellaceae bacterium]|nr:PAS domain S-box protein [Pontiellaceae bacterium]
MKLGTKTILIMIGMMIALLFLLYGGGMIVQRGFLDLETNYSRASAERVVRSIETASDEVGRVAADWAHWDDTYEFIEDRNEDYRASNLIPGTFTLLNIQVILYLDSSGKLVWGEGYDRDEEPLPIASELFSKLSSDSESFESFFEVEDSFSGIILLDQGPMLLASSSIVRSDFSGPSRGLLFMGRLLDEDEIAVLAEPLQVELSVFRVDRLHEHSALEDVFTRLSDSEPIFTQASDRNTVSSFSTVSGVDSKPLLLVQTDMPRDILRQGRKTLFLNIFLLLVGGMLVAGVFYFLLQKTITRPVAALTAATLRVAKGDLNVSVSASANDELGTLASAFNIMMARRRKAERERMLLLTGIDQLADAVMIVDLSGVLQYVNKAFETMSGIRREEVTDQSLLTLKEKVSGCAFCEVFVNVISCRKEWRGRLVHHRNDGRSSIEDTLISPVRDPDGEIVYYIAARRDVTDQAELEEQIHQSQKMQSIGRLVGGIAHDFNNLLQVINGNAEMALLLMEEQQPADEWVNRILSAGTQAKTLIKQLLTFSQQEVIDPEEIQVNHEIEHSLEMLSKFMGEHIELKFSAGKNLGSVRMDRGQFLQVLMNLFSNALAAMPDGGTITIQTEDIRQVPEHLKHQLGSTSDRYVLLCVTDTGCGISPENQKRIFDPFFTTKKFGEARGMGLSIIFGIVQQCNGHIEVYSVLNEGTTFRIYLPVWCESEQEETSSAKPA